MRLREIQKESGRGKLKSLGIDAVYRSYRMTKGNFRNLTVATSQWQRQYSPQAKLGKANARSYHTLNQL